MTKNEPHVKKSKNPLSPIFTVFRANFVDPRNLRPASEYGLPYTQTSYF